MAVECQVVPSADRIASDLIAFIDCEARILAIDGYAVLAAPDSSISLVITAMLTIFVAVFGYRLLFGDAPDGRDLAIAILKVGIVLAFSTSWAAYQPVIYDTVWSAPAELAAELGQANGADPGLSARLDGVDRGFRLLSLYGVGSAVATPAIGELPAEPPPFLGFDNFALGASRILFLVAAVGGFGVIRITAGLLLALGPLFLGFLLFDATRGLFYGWLKGLIGAVLASLALIIALRIGVALLEPWLADLVARRAAGQSVATMSVPLFAATAILSAIVIGMILIAGRLGSSLAQHAVVIVTQRIGDNRSIAQAAQALPANPSISGASEQARSRAAAIADSIATAQRRDDSRVTHAMAGPRARTASSSASDVTRSGAFSPQAAPVRRSNRRVSASAAARDLRS